MAAKVLMLGTYHFGTCGEHMIEGSPKDILNEEKQKELKELIDKLLKFKPNKIAVEKDKENEELINKLYNKYLNEGAVGENNILEEKNEVVQIAFKMGKILNHKKIYTLDKSVSLPMEWLEYCKENEKEKYDIFMNRIDRLEKEHKEMFDKLTVLESFKKINDPINIDNEHSDLYLYVSQIGAGDDYCGVNQLVEWYKRNLYIFGNLQKVCEDGDRVMVLYGAGHCKILRNFIRDYNQFQLVEPFEYLK